VVATARAVAEVREVAYPELEALVEDNARRAFGW
jgi:Tat protein secretion system quality control protein TatD with DNase activity